MILLVEMELLVPFGYGILITNYPEIYCNVFLTYRDYLISECQAKKKAQSKHDWQAMIMKVSLANYFV